MKTLEYNVELNLKEGEGAGEGEEGEGKGKGGEEIVFVSTRII